MSEHEIKKKTRFKKLRETLETIEQQEKDKLEKAKICDRLVEIYKSKDLDFSKKSEMVFQMLATAQQSEKQ